MKKSIKAISLLLALFTLLIPVFACTVYADTESTPAESREDKKDTEGDGGLAGDLTGALTDAESIIKGDTDKKDTDKKDTDKKDTDRKDTDKLTSPADKGDGNVSTGDNGTIDRTDPDDGMSTWVIIIAIIIVVAIIILIIAMMPKKKD